MYTQKESEGKGERKRVSVIKKEREKSTPNHKRNMII